MTKATSIDALTDLAASQWGIFTSAQALDLGVGRTQLCRMSNDGRIESVSYGTYRFTYGAKTSRTGLKATWMSLFPQRTAYDRLKNHPYDAVVVGRTAACLHGDTDFYESPYAFAIKGGKRTARTDVTLYPWEIDDADIEIIDDLPVTSVERTISDLVRSNDDPSLIKNFISGVCSRGHIIDGEKLATLLSPLATKNGFAKGDGAAFVADLLDGLPERLQISRAADTLTRALKEFLWLSNVRNSDSKGKEEAVAAFVKEFSETEASGASSDTSSPSFIFSTKEDVDPDPSSNVGEIEHCLARLQSKLHLLQIVPDSSTTDEEADLRALYEYLRIHPIILLQI